MTSNLHFGHVAKEPSTMAHQNTIHQNITRQAGHRPGTALRSAVLGVAAGFVLSGCMATLDRVASIGEGPALAPIENPVQASEYQPVSLPMPMPDATVHEANSLWRSGARGFFKDQRAGAVGDILIVNIAINDTATVNNNTSRTRDNNEDAAVSKLFGLETNASQFLPSQIDPTNLVDIDSDSLTASTGAMTRNETVTLTVAAIVTQVLPNGNLVIHGTQEVRVNFEVRELSIDGVVRPEDISSTNAVSHEQIAEARILYGGRGTLSDIQRPRYGQELFDIVYPF
jgi:flagellar L-ring protein precursor FlgH